VWWFGRRCGEELTVDALECELLIVVGGGERMVAERRDEEHSTDA